ncbi:adenylate/guanylate cyclase domain-containing protein [Rubrimonas cliftonensis]|uniref:Adenylate cyclase, class 3 n=1 Tax=Rubrimonas cliftonensis TaxID=89524 RepID=A0A1H3ZE55_9RHOB|nr:adenylate/guanylate cyclase domain-containing protein [Rubrimonas cliftonensis]SEA21937.1 Adenylate cyclase, class 3 [Rubrimonas cliftonensis]
MSEPIATTTFVMIADITASVHLYEKLGDAAAYARIVGALERVRGAVSGCGGEPVQSRGDDVLSFFDEGAGACEAAGRMLEATRGGAVSLRLSIHHGDVIRVGDAVYGDAINVAYRLAALANADEALLSGAAARRLPPVMRSALRPMDAFRLKGRTRPVQVFALPSPAMGETTQLPQSLRERPASQEGRVVLRVRHGDVTLDIGEAESLSIGRSEECDLVIPRPWVSRRHAILHVRDGVAAVVDRSSYGTFVSRPGGEELFVRRQTAVLTGSGAVALGASADSEAAEIVSFEVAPAGPPEGGIGSGPEAGAADARQG